MQWRRIPESDVVDSGDEAHRSGEDSELEDDCGLRCCQGVQLGAGSTTTRRYNYRDKDAGDAGVEARVDEEGEGALTSADDGEKIPWVTAMAPPSNLEVRVTV